MKLFFDLIFCISLFEGQRFRYTYYDESQGEIDPMSFTNYLKKYRNTICGRHPIGVLLNVSTTEEETQQVFWII